LFGFIIVSIIIYYPMVPTSNTRDSFSDCIYLPVKLYKNFLEEEKTQQSREREGGT